MPSLIGLAKPLSGVARPRSIKSKQYTPYCIHYSSFDSIAPQARCKFELHSPTALSTIADVIQSRGRISVSMPFYFNSLFSEGVCEHSLQIVIKTTYQNFLATALAYMNSNNKRALSNEG